MLKRTVTGACYIAVIVGFFLLRNIDFRLFDLLTFLFCSIGTFEVARAEKNKTGDVLFVPSVIFGIVFVPTFFLFEYVIASGCGVIAAFICVAVFLISALVIHALYIKNNKDGAKAVLPFAYLPFVYPALPLLAILAVNALGLTRGFLPLLLIFVIPPCTDTMAYLVGMTWGKIKKGNVKKLCPVLSPNKTVAGAIGGLAGGVLGSLILFAIYGLGTFLGTHGGLVFIVAGALASVATQLGDLFESFVKRRAGIKDMGKIMPGHGGIMDRIDGMLLAGVVVYVLTLFAL